MQIHLSCDSRDIEEAFHLAIKAKRSIFDCLYLALAEMLDCRMVTADGKFFRPLAIVPKAIEWSGWEI
jgi:predicted nucleic acid-binding protein